MASLPSVPTIVNPRSHGYGFGALTGPITVDSPASRECYPRIFKDTQDTHGPNTELNCSAIERARENLPVEDHVQDAWDRDLDDGNARGHSELWEFARLCRSHHELWNLDGVAGLNVVVDVLSGPGIDLEDWQREDFVRSWDAIRVQLGESVVSQALKDAENEPLSVSPEHFVSKDYERFVSYVGWLQVARGNRAIIVPVGQVAEVLFGNPKQKMRISRYRRWAVRHCYLRCSWLGSRGSKRANEYWFDVRLWDALEQRAHPGIAESFYACGHKSRRHRGDEVRDRNSPRA